MDTTLIPFESVGNFFLNRQVDDYLKNYKFDVLEYELESLEGIILNQTYSMYEPEEFSLNVENGKIESIMCYSKLTYSGKNLIGMSLDELKEAIKSNYVGDVDILDFEEDNDVPQYVYEFEEKGLQVWTRGENGTVITIIVDGE